MPWELVPAHLQHRQQTREDTGRGVQVTESVDHLGQLGSDLGRERQVVKLFQQTHEDTSLSDSVLASVDFRSQPPSVLRRNNGVTRTAKAAVKFSEQSQKKLKKPIAQLQRRKPAPTTYDVSRSTPVLDGAVPLLTSVVALPESNSAQSLRQCPPSRWMHGKKPLP